MPSKIPSDCSFRRSLSEVQTRALLGVMLELPVSTHCCRPRALAMRKRKPMPIGAAG